MRRCSDIENYRGRDDQGARTGAITSCDANVVSRLAEWEMEAGRVKERKKERKNSCCVDRGTRELSWATGQLR